MNPIGIMQGRLLPPLNNRIQCFPALRWQEEFPAASLLSLDCIEFIFDGAGIHNHPLLTETGRETIRCLMTRYGVRVHSVCADFFMKHRVHSGNTRETSVNVRIFHDLLICCSSLGITTIVLPCVDSSGISSRREMLLLVHNLKRLLRTAESLGMEIAIETDLPPDQILSFLSMVNSPSLKVNYDSGNSASLGYDPVRELNLYGSRISDVHVKDRLLGGGTVPLGEGDTCFDSIFPILHDVGYSGPLILQAARGRRGEELATIRSQLSFLVEYIRRGEPG